jgi:hypothetical protein
MQSGGKSSSLLFTLPGLKRLGFILPGAALICFHFLSAGNLVLAQQPKITIDEKGKSVDISHSTLSYASVLDSANIPPSRMTQSSSNGSVVHDVLFGNKAIAKLLLPSNCTVKANFGLTISYCHFKLDSIPDYSTDDCENNIPYAQLARQVRISDCLFSGELGINNLVSRSFAAQLNVMSDTASYFDLRNSNLRLVTVNINLFANSIIESYNHITTAVYGANRSRNPRAYFSSSFSNYKLGIVLVNNNLTTTAFSVDSLAGVFRYVADKKNDDRKDDHYRLLTFSACYINSNFDIRVADSLYHSKVVFDNCSFGALASIFNINVDTIEFRNCSNIPYPLFLTADPAKKVTCLQLISSSVTNIRFDYTEKFKLYFDKDISEETKNNTYQSLLAKYKAEGKPENLEKIDIEYKRYQYRQHVYSWPLWLLDYVWWRYSYSKWLVIVWCFIFLGGFFWYNWVHWDDMQTVYRIYAADKAKGKAKAEEPVLLPRKLVYVFVFTSFIFFSLRVDFDKLKYSDRRYLFIFFLQYLVGLICLFFLANAIFKI